MTVEILRPSHLDDIKNISGANYDSIIKVIRKNLGLVSVSNGMFGIGRKVTAYASYTLKDKKVIDVIYIDGDENGIKEVIGYLKDKLNPDRGIPAKEKLMVRVGYEKILILKILQRIGGFKFTSAGNEIIASYINPDYAPTSSGSSFKRFVNDIDNPDDEYGLFKGMPWKD